VYELWHVSFYNTSLPYTNKIQTKASTTLNKKNTGQRFVWKNSNPVKVLKSLMYNNCSEISAAQHRIDYKILVLKNKVKC
jgi:hypothetical protein